MHFWLSGIRSTYSPSVTIFFSVEVKLSVSSALKEHILAKYSDDKMGARPLKRALQNMVEDKLAEEILSGRVKAGDTVTAGFRKGQVVFQTAEEKRTG